MGRAWTSSCIHQIASFGTVGERVRSDQRRINARISGAVMQASRTTAPAAANNSAAAVAACAARRISSGETRAGVGEARDA